LPFEASSFDLVTANMVVEHLDRPEDQFREVYRVLRPGGRFIFHTPNAHGHFAVMRRLAPEKLKDGLMRLLDGRDPEDIFPVHYKANSRGKIERVAKMAGFDVVKTKMIVSDAIFSVFPPIAVIELLWIRLLMTAAMKPLRTNIIAVLQKPTVAGR
jgi:ubiquinone/menaquinone biosynthesis C-methylase UbiE